MFKNLSERWQNFQYRQSNSTPVREGSNKRSTEIIRGSFWLLEASLSSSVKVGKPLESQVGSTECESDIHVKMGDLLGCWENLIPKLLTALHREASVEISHELTDSCQSKRFWWRPQKPYEIIVGTLNENSYTGLRKLWIHGQDKSGEAMLFLWGLPHFQL